jgi:hypothetical protein
VVAEQSASALLPASDVNLFCYCESVRVDVACGMARSRDCARGRELLPQFVHRRLIVVGKGLLGFESRHLHRPSRPIGTEQQRGQQFGPNNSNAPVAGRNSFTEGQAKRELRVRATATSATSRRTTMAFGVARLKKGARPSTSASISKAMLVQQSKQKGSRHDGYNFSSL